jgi:hypothetical protein
MLIAVGVDQDDPAASRRQRRLEDGHDRRDPAARREQQEVAVQRGRAEHPGRGQQVQHGPGRDVVRIQFEAYPPAVRLTVMAGRPPARGELDSE